MIATVSNLGERFIDQYIPHHLKPTTQSEYTRAVKLFVTPKMGKLRVADVTRNDIAELHHAMRSVPYQANRVVGVLSVMFAQAEVWGLRPEGTNPCRGIKKYKEQMRERFLSAEELKRLGTALAEADREAISAVNCFRLLILTGCRLSEIQTLKWEYVDLPNSMLHLPDSKTGKKSSIRTAVIGHCESKDLMRQLPTMSKSRICPEWRIFKNLGALARTPEDIRR